MGARGGMTTRILNTLIEIYTGLREV